MIVNEPAMYIQFSVDECFKKAVKWKNSCHRKLRCEKKKKKHFIFPWDQNDIYVCEQKRTHRKLSNSILSMIKN